MRAIIIILVVLPVLVYSCDDTTNYMKDGQCCRKCGPGTRMKQNTDCADPVCQPCENGEYQNGFTMETKCKRQPHCDKNLNFVDELHPSKTQLHQCQCIRDHHCSSSECISCVPNSVCKPGERVNKQGSQMSDVECAPCPNGTFSSKELSLSCLPWTECTYGKVKKLEGSSTSDRTCETNVGLVVGFLVLFLFIAGIVGTVLFFLKKGKTGSACLEQKLQEHCLVLCKGNNHQPVKDNVTVENEEQLITPPNEEQGNVPQENIDETTRLEDPLKLGLSANGMPIDQDHSKTSILSQPESDPSSDTFLGHF